MSDKKGAFSSSSYAEIAIEEVYDIIIDTGLWPSTFNDNKKTDMLEMMISYFQEKEQYEKCAELQRVLEEI